MHTVVQPEAGAFVYRYDERAALAAITPPAGSPSVGQTFTYDYLGRQVTRTRGNATWTTTWESGGATQLDPELEGGQRSTYRLLDGRGRAVVERFGGVPTDLTQVRRDFDPVDQPLRVRETRGTGDVTVTYGYEASRRLLTGITRGGETIAYGRTASGQLDWVTSPTGKVEYGYDAYDRLETIESGTRTTTLAWEPGGARLLELEDATLRECRRYDERGRVRLVANLSPGDSCDPAMAPLAEYTYTYDDRGNRLTEGYRDPATIVPDPTRYGYDGADRLTGVQYPGGTAKLYRLGPDGSRLSEKEVPGYGLGSLGPAAYDSATGYEQTYVHDARGLLTSVTDSDGGTVATYTVDAAGRVKAEARGLTRKAFTWDAGSRLTAATVSPDGGTTVTAYGFRYDHAGLRVQKTGPSGDTRYLWGAHGLAEEVAPDGTRLMYERQGGLVVGVTAKTGAGFSLPSERFMHDGLDSVVGRVRSDGTSTLYRYDAWGSFRTPAQPGAGEPSLAYAGQHWDGDLGLSYAQQRWYEAATGRFLSEDPLFGYLDLPSSLLAFGYANGNPTYYTDPSGEIAPLLVVGFIALGAELGFFGGVVHQEVEHKKGFWEFDSENWKTVGLTTAGGATAGAVVVVGGVAIPAAYEAAMGWFFASGPGAALGAKLVAVGGLAKLVESGIDVVSFGANTLACQGGDQQACGWAVLALKDLQDPMASAEGDAGLAQLAAKQASAPKPAPSSAAARPTAPPVASPPPAAPASAPPAAPAPRIQAAAPSSPTTTPAPVPVPRTGPKGVDPDHHNANVTVRDASGGIVHHERKVSGNMTADEKALGFPLGQNASHTEARATRTVPLGPGQTMTITGQNPPCTNCKGAMNDLARSSGGTVRYQWREDGATKRWRAEPDAPARRRTRRPPETPPTQLPPTKQGSQ